VGRLGGGDRATVTYFNVTHGLTNVWYQFWEEPDAPCFWTDTQANFLETWRHFVAGARSADPAARVGWSRAGGSAREHQARHIWPIMQSFIEFSAAQGIQPDFISYHLFGNAPEQNRRANRRCSICVSANGFGASPHHRRQLEPPQCLLRAQPGARLPH
jgi:hypothetical protein